MAIIISQDGKKTVKVEKSDFENEKDMQEYISQNPEAIPIYEIEEDKELFVVAREFQTESGPIDALAIDKDGDIYIVETKRFINPDKRTVVAQALDYGASMWKHSNNFGSFKNKLDEEIKTKFKISFEEKIKEIFGLEDDELQVLIDAMEKNLNEGNLKFVILMDSIDDRLKDLIIYINKNSQFDIYAVELERYKHDSYEIIIPKLFGAEVRKSLSNGPSSGRQIWTEDMFLKDTGEKLKQKQFEAVQKLFLFSKKHATDLGLGTGTGRGSINPVFNKLSSTNGTFSLKTTGKLGFKIDWVLKKGINEAQKRLLNGIKNELGKIGIIMNENTRESTYISSDELTEKVDDIIRIFETALKN